MAGNQYILNKTFSAAAASGIVARRVVVWDPSNSGLSKLPAATPERRVCGITTEDVDAAGNVGVALAGIALAESDGTAVINPGDNLVIVGTTGRVKSQAYRPGHGQHVQHDRHLREPRPRERHGRRLR